MKKIRLIIWREFITRVRKPSFLIMTILGPLLIAGGITLTAYLSLQETDRNDVLVVDPNGVIDLKLRDTETVKFFVSSSNWSDSAFKDSPHNIMVRFTDEFTNPTAEIYYKKHPTFLAQRAIMNELEKAFEILKLQGEQIDEEAYRRVRKPLTTRMVDIDKVGEESLEQERAGIGFFFGYFMFFFIFLYGVQVMRGVMEEKQNRIVEVLISSVKPFQLMMGKIIGIALVGFTQFILWIVITMTLFTGISAFLFKDKLDPMQMANTPMTAQMQEQLGAEMAMPDVNDSKLLNALEQIDLPLTLAMFVFYFIGGYLLYSSLLAAIGSAVDSESDTQQFMLPATIPMIAALVIAQIAVYNPDSPAVIWCSFIPFTSPVVMMTRVAMGAVTYWELLLSVLLLIGTFLLTTWIAGRIYRTGILMYGKKASWREMARWMFYRG
jgi:ABC-2 type transport system permease protein